MTEGRGLPSDDPEEFDTETLNLLLEESRSVIDHQLSKTNDIDDKALRTVRIETILLGALATASQIPKSPPDLNGWITVGTISLIGSLIAGVTTYAATSQNAGPSGEYIRTVLRHAGGCRRRKVELLESYSDWIDENADVNDRNGTLLGISQIALLLGIALISYGIYRTI